MRTDGVAGVEGRCGFSLAGPCCACTNESKARVEKAECTEIDKKVLVSLEREETQGESELIGVPDKVAEGRGLRREVLQSCG